MNSATNANATNANATNANATNANATNAVKVFLSNTNVAHANPCSPTVNPASFLSQQIGSMTMQPR
jgi:hypothetical protein